MPLSIHPYFRDKQKAIESVGLIPVLNSVGYTLQVALEAAGKQPAPNLLEGSNWFFGNPTLNASGQPHNS